MAKISDEMLTLLIEGEESKEGVRFLSVRKELLPHLETGKYPYRIEVCWRYEGDHARMPLESTGIEMEQFEVAVVKELERNKLAILACISTGEGRREWVFYTRNLRAFGETFNSALANQPTYPLSFEADEDRSAEYFREALALALEGADDSEEE